MSTGYAMIDRPNPNYTQGQAKRRNGGKVTGTIVLHSFENYPDVNGEDGSAESGLAYLRRRTTPGCYHRLVDSDSRIALYPWSWETWGCRVTNNFAVHVCMAGQANMWDRLPAGHGLAIMRNAAHEVAAFIRWAATQGIVVPVRWITREQAMRREPGLIMHGETDPTRRRDPGFDATRKGLFLELVAVALGTIDRDPGTVSRDDPRTEPPRGVFPLAMDGVWGPQTTKGLRVRLAIPAGAGAFDRLAVTAFQDFLGVVVDGDFGPVSRRAMQRWLRVAPDGHVGPVTVRAFQARLNKGSIR